MVVPIRLSEDNEIRLSKQAEVEGVSMNQIANKAIAEYVERHAHRDRVRKSATTQAARFAELMERLK
ncbi:CopG family transcriptional regulator [Nocardia panacis]|uniref:CopG family transcriptional regulator n=1 Tax=Nocardia panacis TaxID=2340916 RepID=A0A3A4K8G2_9NOCA|nr:CopG family transcriptional regulator [Nocardia panacis]RJO75374.1 CopG family transcriptional regulator [Nocardia panacis]